MPTTTHRDLTAIEADLDAIEAEREADPRPAHRLGSPVSQELYDWSTRAGWRKVRIVRLQSEMQKAQRALGVGDDEG